MRWNLLLLLISVVYFTDNTIADNSLDVAGLLEVGIRFIFLNLRRAENITLTESDTIVLPESIKDTAIGSIKLDNAHIHGFKNLEMRTLTANNLEAEENNTKTNLCINLFTDVLGFATVYDADVGILNEIPIYGNGDLELEVSKVDVDLCVNINTEQNFAVIYVDSLHLQIQLRHSLSYILGFWKNNEATGIISLLMNVIEELLCAFLSYENEFVTCLLSEGGEYLVNTILPNDIENNINIDNCLKIDFTNTYSYNELQDILENLLRSYFQGIVPSMTDREIQDIKDLLDEIIQYAIKILNDNGININM